MVLNSIYHAPKPVNRKFNPTNMKMTLNLTSPAPKSRGNNGNASPGTSESKNNDDDAKSPTTHNKKKARILFFGLE